MVITKPSMNKIWASGGAVVQPSDTKIETGWTAEVPPHQWENWIQKRQDEFLAHINERGIPEWDGTTDYLASGKSYVQGSDGVVYLSVAASGPTTVVQDPTTDVSDTYWKSAFAVASTAQAQAWTDNTKQITPYLLAQALKGANQSLTTNGYQKIPGGFIIQWGSLTQDANLSTTYSFPLTFPTACVAVVANKGSNINLAGEYAVGSQATSTSQFTIANTGTGTLQGIFWVAVGF